MENFYGMLKRLLLMVAVIAVANLSYAQQRAITGQVTDAGDGSPIPGVNVIIKGTTSGTITDFDGKFTIQAADTDVLVFSYIGYVATEKVVGAESNLIISLQASDVGLGEVVVIGYGTVKKEDATGSVTAVSSKDFNQGAITSPQDLLMGKASGVQIISNSGQPGSGSTIRIRGGSSLTASNDPLIVIDGVPMNNQNIDGTSNPLSFINPNDIETFTILKDASATAIYGSRASNGVIIITTKKGISNKMQVSYNGNVSMSYAPEFIDVLNGDELRTVAYEKLGTNNITNAGLGRLGSDFTNWQNEIYRTAVSTDHNVAVSGKAKDIPYRVSAGYTKQNGILKETSMDRYSASVNANPSFLNNTLKMNVNGRWSYTKSNFSNTGAVGGAVAFDPSQPIMNGNTRYGGYFTWTQDKDVNSDYNQLAGSNPVALLDLTDNTGNVYRGVTNVQIDYVMPFLPELRANFNAGIDASESDNKILVDTIAVWTRRSQYGQEQDQKQSTRNYLIDFYLNYKKEVGVHSVDLTGGYSWQHFWRQGSTYNRSIVDPSNPAAQELVVAQNSSYESESFLVSFFGRLNYKLLDRYLLTATLRQDGSSKFKGDNKWGLFPSFALAWSIKQESFLKNVDLVSSLKLRLGWGITGQQDIQNNDYPALGTYRRSTEISASYQMGTNPDGSPIFYETLRPNAFDPNIKWEETTTQNIGLDFGFLDERITGSLDYYFRETKDLLNNIAIQNGSNFSNYLTTNVGSLENKGFEIALNGHAIATEDINWNIGINLSYNENKITKLQRTDDPTYIGIQTGGISGGTGNNIQIHSVGYPTYSFFVLQQVYDEAGNPVEGAYVNRSGETSGVDGNLNNFYRYKKPTPDYTIGITSRLSYKEFEFTFSGRVSIGNYVYNNVASETFYGNLYNNNYWRNLTTYINDTQFNNAQYFSDYFVENASFFKMDNMSLGYNFRDLTPAKLRGKLSFVVQNAFTITKYSGLDPEVGYNNGNPGIDNNLYPRARTFLLGLSLDF